MLEDGGSDIPFHKFKNGAHKFRLAPPFDAKTLFHEEWLHWMKTKEGHVRAIPCGKKHYNGQCPLCDRKHLIIRHKEHAEMTGDLVKKQQMEVEARNWGARPTVLWNIMLGDDYKVLQISTNGHVELLKKVKFWWNEKRINLTSPQQNYLIYVERTGEKSTTRYTFEVIDNVPPQQITVPKLLNLATEVYKPIPLEEMVKITQTGFAPSWENAKKKADPNAPLAPLEGPIIGAAPEQNQNSNQAPWANQQPPAGQFPPHSVPPTQPVQAPPQVPPTQPHPGQMTGGAVTPPQAPPVAAAPPAQPAPPPLAPPVAAAPMMAPPPAQVAPAQAPVNQAQEQEIAAMLAALNGGAAK